MHFQTYDLLPSTSTTALPSSLPHHSSISRLFTPYKLCLYASSSPSSSTAESLILVHHTSFAYILLILPHHPHTYVTTTMSVQLHPLHWQPLSRPISHRRPLSTGCISASLTAPPRRPTTAVAAPPSEPALDTVVLPHELHHRKAQLHNNIQHRPQLNDPTLKSTWAHRAWVASGCATVLLGLAKSVASSAEAHQFAGPFLAALIGYVAADLITGVYHWGIDNYGGPHTPIVGAQIEGFQGHHRWPWTITRREFANNLYALARSVTVTVFPAELAVDNATVLAFVAACSGCIMFSQQFHAWAHGTKSRLPPIVVGLQDMGLLISRVQHAAHHRPPYNGNYCIVSGIWNGFLDNHRVFEAMEMVIFFKFGIRPRSWCEPNSDWEQQGEEELASS